MATVLKVSQCIATSEAFSVKTQSRKIKLGIVQTVLRCVETNCTWCSKNLSWVVANVLSSSHCRKGSSQRIQLIKFVTNCLRNSLSLSFSSPLISDHHVAVQNLPLAVYRDLDDIISNDRWSFQSKANFFLVFSHVSIK